MVLQDEFKKVSERLIVVLDNLIADPFDWLSEDKDKAKVDFMRESKLFQSLAQQAGIKSRLLFGWPNFPREELLNEFKNLNKLIELSSDSNSEIEKKICDISTVLKQIPPLRLSR